MDELRARPTLREWIPRVALGLAAISLLLNFFLLAQLRRPERWLGSAAARIAERMGGEDATLRYEVRLPAGTPIRADIPVDETFTVAVDTIIPINTTVRVPFRSPFGSHSIDLPIRASVPLRTQLPVRIRHTFRLSTSTNQEIVVPIELRLDELPLDPFGR